MIKNINERLETSIKEMLIKSGSGYMPFYGEFNLYLNFKHDSSIDTCGVNVTSKGMNFYYNNNFLDNLASQGEVSFIDLHEIFHLLFDHPMRVKKGGYDKKLSNIAQDMIINHIIWSDIPRDFIDIPKNKNGENVAIFPPNKYFEETDGILLFEKLYDWLKSEKENRDKDRRENNDLEQGTYGNNSSDSNGDPIECWDLNTILDRLDDNDGEFLDQHIDSDIPDEYKKSMVDDIKKTVIEKIKMRGIETSDLEMTLEKLKKHKKDHLKDIKKKINNTIMGTSSMKTITRPNRRNINGLKGKRKVINKINVILDTSGSMSNDFERTLSYIFQKNIHVNMIQCDGNVKMDMLMKSDKEIQNMVINGLGGTTMQPAIERIVEKYNNYNTVMLTDGYTDELDLSNIKGNFLLISTEKNSPVKNHPKGKFKIIIIDKD